MILEPDLLVEAPIYAEVPQPFGHGRQGFEHEWRALKMIWFTQGVAVVRELGYSKTRCPRATAIF